MNNSTDLFQGFESEVIASTQLPYCQVQNPPNMSLAQIQQYQPPIGWFIPAEQATEAEFNPTDDWQPIQLIFGEDSPNPREVNGFLATHLRISVLHSTNIEVQEKTEKGWRYLGQAYQYGRASSYGELAKSERDNYRLRTRYLIMFLDDYNLPIHSIPFKLSMSAGVGAAFGTELKHFREEIETAYFKSVSQPKKSLSQRAHSLTVFDFHLGCHKSEGKAPYLYPQIRFAPGDVINTTIIVKRRDRQVQLLSQPFDSLIIPKASATGQTLLYLQQEYDSVFTNISDELTT
ncbi:MAG: DUF5895 domain-containing protein [Waterburya sp.]